MFIMQCEINHIDLYWWFIFFKSKPSSVPKQVLHHTVKIAAQCPKFCTHSQAWNICGHRSDLTVYCSFKATKNRGRIQEFWLGGGAWFFCKCKGPGTALRPPGGPRQSPGGGPGSEAPLSSWILVILGVKFNHIVSPNRWNYTLS